MTREQLEYMVKLCTEALATMVPLSAMVDSHLCIIREMARDELRRRDHVKKR